ncbi:FecR family protein [Parabacteroides goldsteinii]|uniref:FecR family protein n=1 Tax=Parabacteroides goldsteinii TaxID=328812 RepID=UPI00101C5209|nr:FecR domain-containing protein [Parabacteroides goldsteinii]
MDDKLLQLYFEGRTTDEQSRSITEWLDADEANMKYYQHLCRLYEINLWDEQPVTVSVSRSKVKSRRFVLEFLKIAAVFALGFLLNNRMNIPDKDIFMQTVQVPAGQNAQVTLADGSKVWLNAGSTLHFPTRFPGKERLVNLEGEGFFEVQANKEKPFIVSTTSYTIKALGTTFNVNAYKKSKDFETSLLTGKVEVADHAGKQTILLSPNNRVVLEGNKLKTLPIQDSEYFLWREGIICFNEPLSEVLKKLELYFDVKIEVNNKRVLQNEQHCIGKFRSRDGLEHILEVLQLTSHFSYKKDDEKNLVTIN